MLKIQQVLGHVNQYDITDDKGNRSFVSYESHVATIDGKTRMAKVDSSKCFYSRTTSKHFREWAPSDLYDAVKLAIKDKDKGKPWDKTRQRANGFMFANLNK